MGVIVVKGLRMTWFINDPKVLLLLETITTLAGPNFALPYDASIQPKSGSDMLADTLLQFQLPGGAQIQGMADPSSVTTMGRAISGLLTIVAPFVTAYTLILPILGVIRGIIEVICAMTNPFAVIAAVIRLFKKWIPPFIALFPPFAGVLIILGIIKTLLAITFFIITTIIPIFQLIKHDIEALNALLSSGGNAQQVAAEKTKLEALLLELLNQTGILNILKPILDIIMAILQLAGGFPCGSGGGGGSCPQNNITGVVTPDNCGDDATCCNDNVCPPVFKNPPTGLALILPATFSDAPPSFAWTITTITGNENVADIAPYIQSLQQQLNAQLDEPVNEAKSAGSTSNSATFNIKLTGKRGQQTAEDPIIAVDGYNITVLDPSLASMVGVVQYEIIPNWNVLIANNVIGIGCHPDVIAAKNPVNTDPAIVQLPELGDIGFDAFVADLNGILNITFPPYDTDVIDNAQAAAVTLINNFNDNLKRIMNSVLSKISNPTNSELLTDKTLVKAGGTDAAIISVMPRDGAGSLIAKQLPAGVNVDVQIFSSFGTLVNQTLDNTTGTITAELTSLFSGVATVTAKINGAYVEKFDNTSTITQELEITFIADAVLPKRRAIEDINAEREPGGK